MGMLNRLDLQETTPKESANIQKFNHLLNQHLNETIRDDSKIETDLINLLPKYNSLTKTEKDNIQNYLVGLINKCSEGNFGKQKEENMYLLLNFFAENMTIISNQELKKVIPSFIINKMDALKKEVGSNHEDDFTTKNKDFLNLLNKTMRNINLFDDKLKKSIVDFYTYTLSQLNQIENIGNSINFICLSVESSNNQSLPEIIKILKSSSIIDKLTNFNTDNPKLKEKTTKIAQKLEELINQSDFTNFSQQKDIISSLRQLIIGLKTTYKETLKYAKRLTQVSSIIEKDTNDLEFNKEILLVRKKGSYKSIAQYMEIFDKRLNNSDILFEKAIAKIDLAIQEIFRRLTSITIEDNNKNEKAEEEAQNKLTLKDTKKFDNSMKNIIANFFRADGKNSEEIKKYIKKLWHMTRTLDSIHMEDESVAEHAEKNSMVRSFYETAKKSFGEVQKGYQKITNESKQILDLFDMILDEKLKDAF
ncbi:MAG: hypothetical protein A2Y40_07490 [Candidatus Margulisbacteria bacterium GWF2_35_9]|nr:MAG: hypothetical protein A2Y40_07490 [Candidatus Margulisbacteria bacterium GWF2_35_9]